MAKRRVPEPDGSPPKTKSRTIPESVLRQEGVVTLERVDGRWKLVTHLTGPVLTRRRVQELLGLIEP